MSSKELVASLEALLQSAESNNYDIERKFGAAKYAARQAAEAAVAIEYKPGVDASWRAVSEARAALADARTALAQTDTGWLPLGTRVHRHHNQYSGFYRSSVVVQTGVVECWNKESLFTDTSSGRLQCPPNGTVVVRLLKNDGTPSKKWAHKSTRWNGDPDWVPVTVPLKEVK